MSGPLTVPFTAAAVFVESTRLKTLFAVLAATCVLFSCYWVWRQERLRAIALSERVGGLEERVKPRLLIRHVPDCPQCKGQLHGGLPTFGLEGNNTCLQSIKAVHLVI